jgi:hypothetical protein
MSNNIKKIGKSLKRGGMLETSPLCVYFGDNAPALYIGHDCIKGLCLGGITWLGFSKKISSHIKYFVSTGHENFRNGTAEYLKASPKLFEKFTESIGPIALPRKYLVVR